MAWNERLLRIVGDHGFGAVEVPMPDADTEYAYQIEDGSRQVMFRFQDISAEWRFWAHSGVVAGGGGTPIASGEAMRMPGPMGRSWVYFSSSTAGQTMTITFEGREPL